MRPSAPMKNPPTPLRRPAASIYFRGEIEKAEAAGVAREDMVLRLTLGDVAQIKRDRDLAVTDISFAEGEMRFLGVAVVQGGVGESALTHPTADQAPSGAPVLAS